jgi:signal transduction histidine kinase
MAAGMNRDTVDIVWLAGGSAAVVGVVALAFAYLVRTRSLRWAFATVAVCGVLAFVAGVMATAKAMFLSSHDYGVVLRISVAAGVVALAFAFLVARYAVRATDDLRDAARDFGEDGLFSAPADAPAELAAVAAQLDETARRLAASADRERALEASRRELVAWVSHDLRTPLAGLRAMAEALEDGMVDNPARYHAQMRETVDRMALMVDDLFELSRIHAGALQLTMEPVSLEDAISDALAVSTPVATACGVRLGGYAEPGVAVLADPHELGRVIGNLVTNAIRHTPSDGSVEVTGRSRGGIVELAVSDGCGGIPVDDLSRVFDVAWRGTAARTPMSGAAGRKPGVAAAGRASDSAPLGSGAGLGLAIVRGIVEAHRGSVRVDNVGPGCRFLVELAGSSSAQPSTVGG